MKPAADLRIQCSCGALRGLLRRVSASAGNHAICYCDDCQAFTHFLGRADEILDPHGGTQVFQTSPANVEFTDGAENIASMRLSEKGPLRWYASCCNTPIGNTLATPAIPFVGVVLFCIQRPADDPDLTKALGPILARVFRRFAKGSTAHFPPGRKSLPVLILRFVRKVLVWRLRGDHKRSPFFSPATGQPTATPRVLTPAERSGLAAIVAAAANAPVSRERDTPAPQA